MYSYSNYRMPSLRTLIDKMKSRIKRRQSTKVQGRPERSARGSNQVTRIALANLITDIMLMGLSLQ